MMTIPPRLTVPLLVLLMAAPVAGQTASPAPAPATVQGLENFSLPATRPSPVPTPAAPVGLPAPVASATPRARLTPVPRATPTPPPAARPTDEAPAGEAPTGEASRAPEAATPPPVVTVPSPPVLSAGPVGEATPTPAATADAGTVAPEAESQAGAPSWLIPAGIVAILLLGAGVLVWRRRRDAAEGVTERLTAPTPDAPAEAPPSAASPPVEPRRAEVAPAAVEPVVRPWIGLSLTPLRAGVNMATATADVEVMLTNVGDAPAASVRVGLSLLSARSGQDDELGRLFAAPIGRPAVAPFALAPGETRTMRVLVTLPRSAINVLDAGGRPMFVPVVAANIVYDRGDGGTGQTAAAFAIGVERPGAAKLGPFWLDTVSKMHETLGVRPHALSLRS